MDQDIMKDLDDFDDSEESQSQNGRIEEEMEEEDTVKKEQEQIDDQKLQNFFNMQQSQGDSVGTHSELLKSKDFLQFITHIEKIVD